ncbi:MAG: methyltransferase domain-containing protein [Pyrinomonadaceae bacterium]
MGKRVKRVSVKKGYDLWSETYDGTPNPIVAMDARHTLRLLAPQRGERILDAGCGTGRHLKLLIDAGAHTIGLDFSQGMLEVARRNNPSALLVRADLQHPLPFAPARFDALLCALIGEHLGDLRVVFEGMRSVLKPEGRLVFSVYHPELAAAGKEANFMRGGMEYRLGAFRHTVADYQRMLEETGFRGIVKHEFYGDEELARAVPIAAKYLSFPVLLAFEANRE